MTALLPAPTTTDTTDNGDELHHVYCCDENLALCGTDVTKYQEAEPPSDADKRCIVCEDLIDTTCERCGE